MTLGADPMSDRIAVGVLTSSDGSNSSIWLSLWTGTAFEAAELLTDAQVSNMNYPNVAIAFESSSGDALAVYAADGSTTNVHYRTWTQASGWSGELVGPSLGANPNSMTLDGNPSSDEIMLSAQNGDQVLNYVLWDGTAWGAPAEMESNTGEIKNQPFLFLWLGP
jgi:hypothetical protein